VKKSAEAEGRQAEDKDDDSDDDEMTPERESLIKHTGGDSTQASAPPKASADDGATDPKVVGSDEPIPDESKVKVGCEKPDDKPSGKLIEKDQQKDVASMNNSCASGVGGEQKMLIEDSTETDIVSNPKMYKLKTHVPALASQPQNKLSDIKLVEDYSSSSEEVDYIPIDPVELRKSIRRSSVRKYSCDIKSVEPELLVEALENVMEVISQKSDSDELMIEKTIKDQLKHLKAPDLIKEEIEEIIISKITEGLMASQGLAQEVQKSVIERIPEAFHESQEEIPLDLEEEYQEYLKQGKISAAEAAYWSAVRETDPYQVACGLHLNDPAATVNDEIRTSLQGDKMLADPSLVPGSNVLPKPKRELKKSRGKNTFQVAENFNKMLDPMLSGEWHLTLPASVGLQVLNNQCSETSAEKVDKSTYTHPKDFSVVINVTQEHMKLTEEDNMQAIKVCRARDILVGVCLPPSSSRPPVKLKVDQSCWTDFEPMENVDKTKVLKNFFPGVALEDLTHVLQQCGGDVEWAVNILLDSGLEYNEPSSPAAGPSGLSCSVGSPFSGAGRADKEVVSPLAVLCQEKLDTSILLTEEDFQENLVKGSVRRLQSIEEYRKKSMCDNDSNTTSPSDKISPVNRERLPSTSLMNRERVPSLCLAEESYSPAAADKSINELDDMDDEIVTDASQMSLTLSPALAKQLISMFGPVGFHISPDSLYGDDLLVTLNRKTARQIHRRWALTLKEKFQYEEEAIKTMIQEDEALARRLQQEEDEELARLHAAEEYNPSYNPPKTPVMPTLNPVRNSPPPASLQEIMDEEKALEASRVEYMTQVNTRNRDDNLATKMKRMKLLEMFPKVDPQILEEIYSANGYSLGATAEAIQGSDLEASVQTVMSAEAIDAYEQELLEQAKQESLALNQWPGTEEDDESSSYQTLDDPTYQDLRAEASLHYKLRHECFQKAQQAFGSNKKMVASFYSQQGHLHTLKLKAANKRAAEKMLQLRHGSLQQTNTLDLHGLHVDEALDILRDVLQMKETEPMEVRKDQHLTIVTGRGIHSRGGVAKIKPAIMTFLHRNNYHFTEPNPGLLKILLKYRD